MRFLFVHQDFAVPARTLIDQLALQDVVLIIARKNADAPTQREYELLQQHRGAEAAACQLNRVYRKSIAALVTLKYEPKKFRIDDQQLKEWLVPIDRAVTTYGKPSVAFLEAAKQASFLELAPNALLSADDLPGHRWRFATLSADLLARFAKDEVLGPSRDWKANHGVECANSGRVCFSYRVSCGSEQHTGKTEWHLKEGDNTTRESAARVYFVRVPFSAGARVIVFYVGPHPSDGEHSITLTVPHL